MDPFASYAALDNPQQFWLELDDILDTPFHPPSSGSSHASTSYATHDASEQLLQAKRIYVASILAKFLHLCAASFNDNLVSEYNQDYCINRLFSSTAFRDDVAPTTGQEPNDVAMHQLAAEEAIRIMQTSTSIPVLLMTYEIVLQYGDAFPSTYKSIQASASTVSFVGVRAFLHRLVHQIWAGSYAAQAEAKIGISDNQDPVGWNGAHWDQSFTTTTPTTTTTEHDPSPPPPRKSTTPNSSSASKDIAIQISLRTKAVRMLYEVCRVQKLETAHLKAFDERFIHHLFDLVEETRHHHDEDFNYRLIKLLVAMNEQYMVSTLASTAPAASSSAPGQINSATPSSSRPCANLVLGVLQQRLNASKTFGENLIFMLNRASSSDAEDVCMQLLVLKLLYLLFTTKETACYFYTNDLRVLVDIFIRELHDLPDESESLRHTYLRVLHPLLTNTQLCTYPYKRPQIRRLLTGLISHGHLNDISATTKRLVERCLRAEWCVELDRLDGTQTVAKVEPIGGGEAHAKVMHAGVTTEGLPMLATRIKEGSGSVQATAASLAVTTEDHVASPSSISTTLSPTDANSTDSSLAPTSGSLSVPSTLRTRDKRVASLSHPHSEAPAASTLLRPNSAASLSRATAKHVHGYTNGNVGNNSISNSSSGGGRRTVSAQSAPCTPPRVDSPLFAGAGAGAGARPISRLSATFNAALDATENDETLSNSSSWHAHMLEDAPTGSGKHRADAATAEAAAASETSHVGSRLSPDSTRQVLPVRCADASPDPTVARAVAMSGTASSTGSGDAPRRRKPPQPPTMQRRALMQTSSEPHSLSVSAGGGGGGGGGIRSDSAYDGAGWSTGTSPANEDAPPAAAAAAASGGKSGVRRRPPPPPPAAAAGAAVGAQNGLAATANQATLLHAGHERGTADEEEEEDQLANAQSWYIAERLRRGLRIR